MEEQSSRGIGIQAGDATVWDYASGDDDVVVVHRVTEEGGDTDYSIHANVINTAVLQQAPAAH